MSENSRVMLNNVRLAFPVLEEPEQFQGTGKPRFSATLLIEPAALVTVSLFIGFHIVAFMLGLQEIMPL